MLDNGRMRDLARHCRQNGGQHDKAPPYHAPGQDSVDVNRCNGDGLSAAALLHARQEGIRTHAARTRRRRKLGERANTTVIFHVAALGEVELCEVLLDANVGVFAR